jgi:heat-inducible transcriptional repressor
MAKSPPPELSELVLSEREQRVLEAIVAEHIKGGEPVGSRALAEGLDVSSATVRNVMAELHEAGLIAKPHASSGRVPTDAGFRFYVDSLLRIAEPPDRARAEIKSHVRGAPTVDRALEEAGRVLARLSQKACLVRAPSPRAVRLKQIELVRLRDDACLVILVTSDGSVQNRVVELREPGALTGVDRLPDPAELMRMSHWLTERVDGKTLAEARPALAAEIAADREELDRLEKAALALGANAVGSAQEGGRVVVEGERHLLEGGGVDVERMHALMGVLEENERLLQLLDRADDAPGVRIFIGEENPLRELAGMSVVTSSYGNDVEVFGALGVIGPTRMDYARVVPLVELTARAISTLLRDG